MSVECVVWALNDAPIPRTRRDAPSLVLTLVGLANHANPDGTDAFPAVSTLVKYTRLSESTVRRALDALEELELITPSDPAVIAAKIKRADRRPQGWDLAIHRRYPQVVDGVSPRHPVEPHGVSTAADGVSAEPERGVTVTPEPSFIRPGNRPDPERGCEGTLALALDPAPIPETDGETEHDGEHDPTGTLAAEIVAGLTLRCGPSARQLDQIRAAVASALRRGVPAPVVAEYARRKARQADTVKYLVQAFSAAHLPVSAAPAAETVEVRPAVPPLCGQCEAKPAVGAYPEDPVSARIVWLDADRTRSQWCPRCHPRALAEAAQRQAEQLDEDHEPQTAGGAL